MTAIELLKHEHPHLHFTVKDWGEGKLGLWISKTPNQEYADIVVAPVVDFEVADLDRELEYLKLKNRMDSQFSTINPVFL